MFNPLSDSVRAVTYLDTVDDDYGGRSRNENWFKRVFGFHEKGGFKQVKSRFQVSDSDEDRKIILSTTLEPKRIFYVGAFGTPMLSELRAKAGFVEDDYRETCSKLAVGNESRKGDECGALTFQNVVGSVEDLHRAHENEGAVFQAASQFNCLEMVGPEVTPEDGITDYILDRTQGPACAMVCPAGTVYRNYFATGDDGGQLDTLKDVGIVLGNSCTAGKPVYWKMKNGYALAVGGDSIKALSHKIEENDNMVQDAMSQLRVGVHWSTEVDMKNDGDNQGHRVTQVYCSALPIAYDSTASEAEWETFAQLVLDGSYEATLAVAAILAKERNARVRVFLTLLGGGAFGNDPVWIRQAIRRAVRLYREYPLDVYLVHYSSVGTTYEDLAFDLT